MNNGAWNYILPTHPFHDPLIMAGHVGFSLDRGRSIFGFEPIIKYNLKGLLNSFKLKKRVPLEAQIADNTDLFHRAANQRFTLFDEPVKVYAYEVEVSDEIYDEIVKDIRGRPIQTKYAFPKKEEFFAKGVANCATYLDKYNIPIPEKSGWMHTYIKRIKFMPNARRVHYFSSEGEISSVQSLGRKSYSSLELQVKKWIRENFKNYPIEDEDFGQYRLFFLKRLIELENESQSVLSKNEIYDQLVASRNLLSNEEASQGMHEINKLYGKPKLRTFPKRVGKSCLHYIRSFLGKKSNVFE